MCYVLSLYVSTIQNILFILLMEITVSVHVSVIQITEHFIHPAYGQLMCMGNDSVSCVWEMTMSVQVYGDCSVSSFVTQNTFIQSCLWKLQFMCMEIKVSSCVCDTAYFP